MRGGFAWLARERRLGLAGASVAIAGAIWAGLCLRLAADGHAPSVTLVAIPRGHYYLAQALFVVPVLLAQWLATAGIAQLVTKARFVALAAALGPALAAPLVVVFLVPDLVAYALVGFGALGKLVRITAPLVVLTTIGLSALAIRAVTEGASRWRAIGTAALAVTIPAVLASTLLR